jgi:hypothetical protein
MQAIRGSCKTRFGDQTWVVLVLLWFLANRHILLVIGGLREIRIRRQKRKFGPKSSLAIPSLVNELQSNAAPKARSDRHGNRAQRFDRPALLTDDFGDIFCGDSNFNDSSLLAIKNLHLDRIRLVDEIFNQIGNEIFHSSQFGVV